MTVKVLGLTDAAAEGVHDAFNQITNAPDMTPATVIQGPVLGPNQG